MSRGIAVATGLLLFTAPPAIGQSGRQQPDGDTVIGRAAQAYRALRSLKADFVQMIDNPMIDSATSRGTLMQTGAAKFAMRFSDPSGEAIVIDGKHIWIYTPSTTPGQVLRLGLPSGGPAYGYNLLAWLLDRPAERYHAKWLRAEPVQGRMTDVVELTPAVPDLPFTRAVLWLDRGNTLPRRLEIHEGQGSRRTLTLSNIRTDERIPATAFTFAVPPNTRIIDQ